MKKVIFTLLSLFVLSIAYSQTTYYWVGGTGSPAAPANWNTGTNWNTMQNGTGTDRAVTAASDVLIFDGSNVGGSTTTTGPVVVAATTQTFGRLVIQAGADVAISRNGSGGTTTLTVGELGASLDALVVFAGCTLRIGVPSPGASTGSLNLLLNSNAGASNSPPATQSATGIIYGNVIFEDGTNSFQNRITVRLKNALLFVAGSTCTVRSGFAYYPFGTSGSSSTPVNDGVIFQSGSSYYYNGGTTTFANPFGSNSTSFHVKFLPGSKFYFRAPAASNLFSGRKYGDVIIQNNSTVISDGSFVGMDSLRIEAGSTFVLDSSGNSPILGHILNNGTLRSHTANPGRANRLLVAGSTPQNMGGTGTFTLGRVTVSNASSLTLQKSIQVDTSTYVIGTLNPNGFSITGSGTVSVKPPASVNQTGTLVAESHTVSGIADFTGIEVGMSVSGTGVPAGTVVVGTSTGSGTITLSKPATSAGTVPLTIFNGQGQVLPVEFGSISAAMQNGKAKVSWTILTEESILGYSVERSANSREFAEVGYVQASGVKQYSLLDESPLAGNNYYRIKAIGKDGDITYSVVVKVFNGTSKGDVAVYPNPVKGGELNVQLNNMEKGTYTLRLINSTGQLILNKVIVHQGGSLNQVISLPGTVKAGVYSLQVSAAELSVQRKVLVQ